MHHKEHFADYAPLLPALFSLNHVPTAASPLYGSTPNAWDPDALERTVRGLTAVLLSLKKKPVIRYEKMSGMTKKLAVEIQVWIIMKLCTRSDCDLYVIAPSSIGINSVRFPADTSSSIASYTR
jgi:hypothetical protein